MHERSHGLGDGESLKTALETGAENFKPVQDKNKHGPYLSLVAWSAIFLFCFFNPRQGGECEGYNDLLDHHYPPEIDS